jgi:hypothetical protein
MAANWLRLKLPHCPALCPAFGLALNDDVPEGHSIGTLRPLMLRHIYSPPASREQSRVGRDAHHADNIGRPRSAFDTGVNAVEMP